MHAIAGQAVVQFARSTHDGYPYAIKFYVSRSAFEAEKKLYRCVAAPQSVPSKKNTEPVCCYYHSSLLVE